MFVGAGVGTGLSVAGGISNGSGAPLGSYGTCVRPGVGNRVGSGVGAGVGGWSRRVESEGGVLHVNDVRLVLVVFVMGPLHHGVGVWLFLRAMVEIHDGV